MFYSYSILAKKGPLAKIWLAAHWTKKLTKSAVFQTNIHDTCQDIAEPVVPLALRVSGHLLLGVVRVYSRQVNYLFADCSEAMHKIRMAFKTGDVNMAEETAQASGTALNMNGFGELDEDPMMLSDFEDEDGLAMPLAAADNLWVKMTSQAPSVSVNDLDDDEFDDDMPALREEMLPAADLDLAPTPGDVRQSMGSMPQLRGAGTPGQDEEFYGNEADDFVPDNYMDDSAMGAGQLEEEALPPADMSLGDAASGRPSMLTATPGLGGSAGLLDDTPGSIHINAGPTVGGMEMLTKADLEQAAQAGETKVAQRKSKKRAAPVQDRQTQLAPKTIKNWNENPGETLLPRATTTKRLRRQRETAQAHWRSAIGFPTASGPFMPSMMTSASPEVMGMFQRIATGPALPAASELPDDVGASSVAASSVAGGDAPPSPLREDGEQYYGNEADDFVPFYDESQLGLEDDAQMGEAEEKGVDTTDAHGAADDDAGQLLMEDVAHMSPARDDTEPVSDARDPDKLGNMMHVLDNMMHSTGEVVYQDMARGKSRQLAAECFFKLLKLKSLDVVEVDQNSAFGDIVVTKTATFDTVLETGKFTEIPQHGAEEVLAS